MHSRPSSSWQRLSAAAGALDARVLAGLQVLLERSQLGPRAVRATREIALILVAVLLVGMGAATAGPRGAAGPVALPAPTAPAASPAASPDPAPVPQPTPAPELAARAPDLSKPQEPAPAPAPAQAAPAAAPQQQRWLPTGTGMWLHDWRRSEEGHAAAVVARAQQVGLSHLYVQTGSSRKGWIGEEVLSQLMPATAGTGIAVIAWDFPKLIDPEDDARRLAKAAWWNRPGAPMVAAVAPDVETAAEGTMLTADRVDRYYAELRKRLPARTAILATVPWPSEKRTGSYPYATTAPYSDAFVPMAYWYNRSPSTVTKTSMQWLKRFGLPVMPVGQGYDGRIDAPYLKQDPAPDKSVAAFIYVAREQGAQSLSLWSWQTTGPLQWGELAKAAGRVGPQPASPEPAPAQPEQVPAVVPEEGASPAAEPAAEPAAGAPGRDAGREAAPGRQHDRPRGRAEGR